MREQLKDTASPGQHRIALVTYSTKARGGVVHTLSVADAMADQGMDVRIVALPGGEKSWEVIEIAYV